MTKWGIPGMSLAITQGERLVFARGFGLADKGKNINVNPTHRFRVASVSKPITATTLMYIIEKNPAKLSLNTPVFGPQGFLGKSPSYSDADFRGKGQIFNNLVNGITLQNLTEHRSGWADNVAPGDSTDLLARYGQSDFIPGPPPHAPSQNELIDYVLRKHPPYFGAGATQPIQYNYSNFGYSVIGRVIEKFSGKSYEQYVRETVLKESGITQMAIGKPGFKLDNEVQYYESDPRNNPDSIPIDKYDSFGGWVATPIELTRFMVATDNHPGYKDVVGTASEIGMWGVATPGSNYGRGWIVGANQHGHNGVLPGTGSFVWARDDIGTPYTFAIIGNQNAGYFKPVNDTFSVALLGNVSALLTEVNKWPSYDLF
jgi:CubicO group peptidase (beta-lactamase class C family)